MGRADKMTLPQQSNRQDIANREKKICCKLIIQIKTDQDSTVFWYWPHLLQISQASAARDSWTALIVGEHIYFERLVGSFESPSNTVLFFFSQFHSSGRISPPVSSSRSVEEKGFATDRFVLKAGEVLFLSFF